MRDRVESMRRRVAARCREAPLGRTDLLMIDACVSLALEHRDALLADDHHIDLLHPARTVLILLDDAGMTAGTALAAAALLESHRADLAADLSARPLSALEGGAAVRALLAALPTPLSTPADELVEAVLALDAASLDVVLAERLDHARHLRLRPAAEWPPALALEETVYLAVAQRRGGLIGRRYERWHRAFTAGRYAGPQRAP